MTSRTISTRHDLATAAAGMTGNALPLSPDVPEDARIYLYAVPEEEGSAQARFSADRLSAALAESGMRAGIERDPEHPRRGVRFVGREPLSEALAPFATLEARSAWTRWRTQAREMSRCVADAAHAAGNGEPVLFDAASSRAPRRTPDLGER